MRAEGFRQAQVRLSGLGQQGVAAVLRRSIGGEYNYYSYTESVWGVPAVCRFRQVLFGDLLTGKERRAHGKVKSGISGVVRVQVHHMLLIMMNLGAKTRTSHIIHRRDKC